MLFRYPIAFACATIETPAFSSVRLVRVCNSCLTYDYIVFIKYGDLIVEYYSLNRYLKDTFGQKVYKIALDGGFTCPNRDGRLGSRGCIFCSAGGSGDFASDRSLSITDQIEQGKARLTRKFPDHGGNRYIAYFQAFTNTYAPVERLRQLYEEAMNHPQVCALSIATRPDCLPLEVLELLDELNRIKPIWVELGLQTIHPQTAEYIRRGYPLTVYDRAVYELKKRNIQVIVHVILGLPGETEEMMKETVRYVGESKADGIKLQLLHVLKGTDLAADFLAGKFQTLSMENYVRIVADCLMLLPPDMVIHRMTGDGDKKILLAPLWSGDKKRVIQALKEEIAGRVRNEYDL